MSCFSFAVSSLKSPSEQFKEDFLCLKKDLMNLFLHKNRIIEQLKYTNTNLEEMNRVLSNQVISYEEENNRKKFCVKCHMNFSNKEKDENLCIYHPGELKYYSCKGCGADEYFTCCNKCKNCSVGCKKSKHVSENK